MSSEQDREREELEQLLAAEALSANDFADAADRALMNKLLEDGDLAEEFEGYQEAAAQLALATEPVQPPASMKDALFAKLDGFPQQNPVGEPRADADSRAALHGAAAAQFADPTDADSEGRRKLALAPEPAPGSDADGVDRDDESRIRAVGGGASAAATPRDLGPAETRARGRWFRSTGQAIFAAAAALIVAVGLFVAGGAAFGGFGQQGEQDQIVADGEVAQILAASDVDSARTEVEGGGTVTVYWSEELGRSAVVAHGMAQLPADNDYELWYIDGEGPAAAGILAMAGDSPAVRVLDGTFVPGMAIGVTVEPKGGSETGVPSSAPVAVVQS